jgi:molybdopterin converting factor small subunit
MIKVRCLGHIKTSLGRGELEIEGDGVEAADIVEKLREMAGGRDAGFDSFNTLAMVGEGEAFVPASRSRKLMDGESLVLIPFSHGG